MNKELKDKELENVTGGIDNIDVHEQAALKNSNITTAPNLPATEFNGSEYSGMFSTPTSPGQYEPHFYKGKVVDPTYFINKTENSKNE